MRRRANAHRIWLGRRLLIQGAGLAAVGGAAAIQASRLEGGRAGAAVHGIALLVSLFLFLITAWLLVRLLSGPGRGAPAWKRHEHRDAVREAPLVSGLAGAIALILCLATPGIVYQEAPIPAGPVELAGVDFGPSAPAAGSPAPEPSAVPLPEPPPPKVDRPDPPAPVVPESAPVPTPVPAARREPVIVDELPPPAAPPPPQELPVIESPTERPTSGRDLEEALRPARLPVDLDAMMRFLRLGVPGALDSSEPVPVTATFAGMLAGLKGRTTLESAGGRFHMQLQDLRDSDDWAPSGELGVDFPLTPRDLLTLRFVGLRAAGRGRFEDPVTIDGKALSDGQSFQYTEEWSHLFAGFTHRLWGFTRDSVFDLALHLGTSLDHTRTVFEVESASLLAETAGGERGWGAPALGVTAAFWSQTSGGLTLEVFQTVPVNIGGQAIALTDVRLSLRQDVSETVTFHFGFRWISASYRTFEDPIRREDGRTATALQFGGPLVGLDLRF